MKLKTTLIIPLCVISFNALSADVPVATDTGTITVKGNIYSTACTVDANIGNSTTLAIPTTYAAEYSKGDASPESTPDVLASAGVIEFTCPSTTGVTLRVDGVADALDTNLYQVTPGTGKASGVALKVTASSLVPGSNIKNIDMIPNQENSTVFSGNEGESNTTVTASFAARAVAVSDKVTSGDLSTTLTWTALYN